MPTLFACALALTGIAHAIELQPSYLFDWGGPCARLYAFWCEDRLPGQFTLPLALDVDLAGNVYVADSWNQRVQKFDATGHLIRLWSVPGYPQSIAIAHDGSVLVDGGPGVLRYSKDGVRIGQLVSPMPLPRVWDIVGDAVTSSIYVLAGNYVHKFRPDGAFVKKWGGPSMTEPGNFPSPQAIACDAQGRVYVLDQIQALQIFDSEGQLLDSWPGALEGGRSWSASGMLVDDDGTILLAQGTLRRYSATAELLAEWRGPRPLFNGIDLARTPDELLYVPDVRNGRIAVFGRRTVFQTDPAGVALTIDGATVPTLAMFDWVAGSSHAVEAPELIEQEDARFQFASWSDGGSRVRTIVAADPPLSYQAVFRPRWRVRAIAGAGVHVDPAEVWVDDGARVTLTASIDAPLGGVHWEGTGPGSYTGSGFQITVHPEGPVVETAYYVPTTDQYAYDFTISASDTDPHVHVASPVNGVRPLYLWLTCAPQGLSAFECAISGTLDPLGFIPMNGVLNALDARHLMLAVGGCPQGLDVAMVLGVCYVTEPAAGGTFCLQPSPNGILGAVDCDPLDPILTLDVGVRGFDSAGGEPCDIGSNSCGFPGARTGRDGASIALARPKLLGGRPNPFGDRTEVRFVLGEPSRVRLAVYDVAGRLVDRLVDHEFAAGEHGVPWLGRDATGRRTSPGVYFVRLESLQGSSTMKLVRQE